MKLGKIIQEKSFGKRKTGIQGVPVVPAIQTRNNNLRENLNRDVHNFASSVSSSPLLCPEKMIFPLGSISKNVGMDVMLYKEPTFFTSSLAARNCGQGSFSSPRAFCHSFSSLSTDRLMNPIFSPYNRYISRKWGKLARQGHTRRPRNQ